MKAYSISPLWLHSPSLYGKSENTRAKKTLTYNTVFVFPHQKINQQMSTRWAGRVTCNATLITFVMVFCFMTFTNILMDYGFWAALVFIPKPLSIWVNFFFCNIKHVVVITFLLLLNRKNVKKCDINTILKEQKGRGSVG